MEHLLLDPRVQAAKRYNALWRPRAYALDARGSVTHVQPDTTLDPQAPLEVKKLWENQR